MVPNNRQEAVQHTQMILGLISQTTLKESGQKLSKNYFLRRASTSSGHFAAFFLHVFLILVRFKSTDDCLFLRFSGVTLFIFSMKPGYILKIANSLFFLANQVSVQSSQRAFRRFSKTSRDILSRRSREFNTS